MIHEAALFVLDDLAGRLAGRSSERADGRWRRRRQACRRVTAAGSSRGGGVVIGSKRATGRPADGRAFERRSSSPVVFLFSSVAVFGGDGERWIFETRDGDGGSWRRCRQAATRSLHFARARLRRSPLWSFGLASECSSGCVTFDDCSNPDATATWRRLCSQSLQKSAASESWLSFVLTTTFRDADRHNRRVSSLPTLAKNCHDRVVARVDRQLIACRTTIVIAAVSCFRTALDDCRHRDVSSGRRARGRNGDSARATTRRQTGGRAVGRTSERTNGRVDERRVASLRQPPATAGHRRHRRRRRRAANDVDVGQQTPRAAFDSHRRRFCVSRGRCTRRRRCRRCHRGSSALLLQHRL